MKYASCVLLLLLLSGCTATQKPEEESSAPSTAPSLAGTRGSAPQQNFSAATKKRQKGKKKQFGISALLRRLPLQKERRIGYRRDLFVHWSDLDKNGCSAREDVLYAENLRRPDLCWKQGGLWYSAYDGTRSRDSGSFDVDHVVPLAEAWDSGAWRWSAVRRERFANDLWGPSLRAVSASSNRSKSDRDPSEWLPRRSFHCRYALDWVAIKFRWDLSIDRSEKAALRSLSRRCSLSLRALPKRAL